MNDSIAQDVKSIKKGVKLIVAIMLVQLIVFGLYIILEFLKFFPNKYDFLLDINHILVV